MAQVKLEKIFKRWSSTDGVESINLDIADGEFVVLVGPSGCGKSTILRMIAGLEQPTSGNLYIGDRLVNQIPARQRDVAMVFQNYALYPHMTVAENLSFGLKMRKIGDRTAINQRIHTVAASLGIEQLLTRKPAQLSGGQQQRVALGRAIAREPQVFLLDEPLSNLDAQLRDDTRGELKLLHQKLGITMIYVTHDQTEAMTLADRIVVLNRGRIQQVGSSSEIYHNPQNLMVATFLGSPPMNILTVVYRNHSFVVDSNTGGSNGASQVIDCPETMRSLLISAEGQSLKLGIRPEHLQPLVPHGQGTRIDLKIVIVEALGNRTLIKTCLVDDPEQFIYLEDRTNRLWHAGDSVWVEFKPEHLFLFDPTSGDRIS
ncbi:ATPase component of ABC-type sugar transporter [Synechococcus sp. PCC 7502]|uniref:ABC transporter ATP-binding protein n=1 Tax=Synechococcus sp. PCC 7502 TaxID=1173263 RepID=UPI00029FD13C|nr:ABC transporter ATP-binding protein [Synechococcus sp. PCC 7502]AFY72893.1 ATPase component of ABC-type sugar transporter [Synechococcus sp. PCC 7502]